MPQDPLHADVARRALELPEAGGLVLAGGGAMLAHGLINRPTVDVDLFTPTAGAIPAIAQALTDQLRADGWTVEVDERRPTSPSFARLHLTSPDGQSTSVDLAQDFRLREPVRLDVGPVLHPEEIAADKTLALTTRGEPRDLLDVDALAARFGRARLPALAAEKDAGFNPREFARGMRVAAGHSDAAFAALGLTTAETSALRDRAGHWAAALTGDDPAPAAAAQRAAADLAATGYPKPTQPPAGPAGETRALPPYPGYSRGRGPGPGR